ncbi:MAG: hypothetical protein K6F76_01900 [Clostridiales bacterium]|nr:hypothetical protein [Clostridiales bacterium]
MDKIIISQELYFLLYSVIFGAFIGVYYDVFRFLRELGINSQKAVIIQDLFFFISISVPVFLFFCAVNKGNISPYSLAVMFAGFLIYRYTAGRLTMLIFKLILIPFKALFRLISGIFKKIRSRLCKRRAEKQLKLHKQT